MLCRLAAGPSHQRFDRSEALHARAVQAHAAVAAIRPVVAVSLRLTLFLGDVAVAAVRFLVVAALAGNGAVGARVDARVCPDALTELAALVAVELALAVVVLRGRAGDGVGGW